MVREGRLSLNLGVRELARKARCSPASIVCLEFGRAIPRPEILKRIAKELGRDPSELSEAALKFKAAIRSRSLIPGKPVDLVGNFADLPLIAETLAAIRTIRKTEEGQWKNPFRS